MASTSPYDQYGQYNGAGQYNAGYNTGYQGYVPPDSHYAPHTPQTTGYQQFHPHSDQPEVTTTSSVDDQDPNRCRDKFCAGVFVLHLLAILGMAFYSFSTLSTEGTGDSAQVIALCVFASGCVGIFFACVWLQVLKSCAGAVISTSYFVLAGLCLVSAFASLAAGTIYGLVVGLIMAGLTLLSYFCIRRRIPFTEKLIEPAVSATGTYYGVFVVALGAAIVSVLYSILFAVAITTVNINLADDTNDDARGFLWACFAVSFLWTIETLNNITFVTTAGAVGTWWLQSAAYSTWSSLKRASINSLGSVALGSFLVALITYCNILIRHLRHENRDAGLGQQIAIACLQCIGDLLEEALRFFNRFAYAQIGLYGKSFIPAAKDAYDLLKARGFDAIINDDLTGLAIGLGVFICSILNLCVVGVAAYAIVHNSDSIDFKQSAAVLFIFCFIIGGYTASIILNQIYAAVTTTFVLWAQEPDAMSQTRPQEYQAIEDARQKAYM